MSTCVRVTYGERKLSLEGSLVAPFGDASELSRRATGVLRPVIGHCMCVCVCVCVCVCGIFIL